MQLIKAAKDSHLWADTFDRKLTDIFSVESEVPKAIAEQLRAKLTGQEEQVLTAKPTDNVEAYDTADVPSVRRWMLLPLPLPKGEDEGEGFSASKVGSFQMRTSHSDSSPYPSPRSRRRGDRSKALRCSNSATPDA